MSVYFIGDIMCGLVKIGRTGGPVKARLSQLQVSSPHELVLLSEVSTEDSGEDLESELHQRYASDRIRGEWFRATGSLLHEIESLALSELGDAQESIRSSIREMFDRMLKHEQDEVLDGALLPLAKSLSIHSSLAQACHSAAIGDSFSVVTSLSAVLDQVVGPASDVRCMGCFVGATDTIKLCRVGKIGAHICARCATQIVETLSSIIVIPNGATTALERELSRAQNDRRWLDAASISLELEKVVRTSSEHTSVPINHSANDCDPVVVQDDSADMTEADLASDIADAVSANQFDIAERLVTKLEFHQRKDKPDDLLIAVRKHQERMEKKIRKETDPESKDYADVDADTRAHWRLLNR